MDLNNNKLVLHVDEEDLQLRSNLNMYHTKNQHGLGRELFGNFRQIVTNAETGATSIL